MTVADLQAAKRVVLDYYDDLDRASIEELAAVLRKHTTDDYSWRGMHPWHEQAGADAVAERFWVPLRESFSPIQRRPDIFLAGESVVDDDADVWVCQMGHLLGLFDQPWLGIPPTHRMCFHRYAQFHRVRPAEAVDQRVRVGLVQGRAGRVGRGEGRLVRAVVGRQPDDGAGGGPHPGRECERPHDRVLRAGQRRVADGEGHLEVAAAATGRDAAGEVHVGRPEGPEERAVGAHDGARRADLLEAHLR